MKKFFILSGVVGAIVLISCNSPRRNPGSTYMPDMAYSRAYETYAALDSAKFTDVADQRGGKIFYNANPVPGTVARGDNPGFLMPYDTTLARTVKNPLPPLSAKDYIEASRLYLIYCGICHGPNLDGQGPLFTSGTFIAAPRNFIADPFMLAMPEGTMFHSVTYGKNMMGSYASQLTSKQRWMIIHYIKEKQSLAATKPATAVADTTAKTDSVVNQ